MTSSANQTLRPSITAAAGAGTGAPAPGYNAISTDTAGLVRFGSGTSPNASVGVLTLTFGKAFSTPPIVVVTASNAATAALGSPYIGATGSLFTVYFPTALTASQPNTAYGFSYVVIGTEL